MDLEKNTIAVLVTLNRARDGSLRKICYRLNHDDNNEGYLCHGLIRLLSESQEIALICFMGMR